MGRRWWLAVGGWALLGVGSWAPAWAGDSLAAVVACRSITDATSRLACFDRESAGLVNQTRASGAAAPTSGVAGGAVTPSAAPMPAPERTAAPVSAPPLDPEKQFGLPEKTVVSQEVAAGTRAADKQAIDAHILGFAAGADGRGVFTLDNGQIWRQVNSTGEMLIHNGDTVTISRAALGSYWLQVKSGRGCKVSRLR